MARLSPATPYAFKLQPNRLIKGPHGEPVAIVDTVFRLAPGYKDLGPRSGLSALGPMALTESLAYPKRAIVDSAGRTVAIVMGVGKVFPGYQSRTITAAEAAISGQFDWKLAPVVVAPSAQIERHVRELYPGQHPRFVRRYPGFDGGIF